MNFNNPGPGKITLLLSFSMAVIFLAAGCFFVFTNTWIDKYPRPYRIWIGLILMLWAFFRGVTVWMKFKQLQREERENEE